MPTDSPLLDATTHDTNAENARAALALEAQQPDAGSSFNRQFTYATAIENASALGLTSALATPRITASVNAPVMSAFTGRMVTAEVQRIPAGAGLANLGKGIGTGLVVSGAELALDKIMYGSTERGKVTMATDLVAPLAIGMFTRFSLPVKAGLMIAAHAGAQALDHELDRMASR